VLAVAQSAELGGAEYALLRIARRLEARDFEMQLTVPAPGPLSEAAHEEGLVAHRLAVGPLTRGAWARALPSLPRSRRLLRQVDPELVYFNGTVAQRLAPGFPRVTFVPHVHDLLDASPRPWRSRRFWERTPVVLCDSQAVADAAVAAGAPADRLRVVGCPVEPVEPAPRPPWAEGEVIGYVGRIEPRKGTLELVLAARSLLERRPQARLVVIGADELGAAPQYERLVHAEAEVLGDRILVLPPVRNAARLMPWFDVLCVPSRREPFGTVAAEALAAGTPVVATDSGGMREFLVEGESGALVRPGDPAALSSALERVLDGESGTRESVRGAAAPFHADTVADSVAAALREALGEPEDPAPTNPVPTL
jgi:glycosyltransferase involved in cell wall biosynthesis